MIWGTTKSKVPNNPLKRTEWHAAFALTPVRLLDGRWAWLEHLERISYYASEIPVVAHQSPLGWCWRAPSIRQPGGPYP